MNAEHEWTIADELMTIHAITSACLLVQIHLFQSLVNHCQHFFDLWN